MNFCWIWQSSFQTIYQLSMSRNCALFFVYFLMCSYSLETNNSNGYWSTIIHTFTPICDIHIMYCHSTNIIQLTWISRQSERKHSYRLGAVSHFNVMSYDHCDLILTVKYRTTVKSLFLWFSLYLAVMLDSFHVHSPVSFLTNKNMSPSLQQMS